jgi:two-component system CheB/CheR fusion protein
VALSSVLIYAGYRARRAEVELAHANEGLREDDAAKDRFLLGLAHELRGPLQVVLNSLALTRAMGTASAGVTEQMQLIERQIRGADRIVEDLLDMERVRRGKLSLQLRPVDLRVCVEESLQRCEAAVAASGQRLTVSSPPTPVLACVDRHRIVQVLSNLLENAVKYAGASATVTVLVEEDGDTARLVVKDDGAGVASEALTRLMDQRDTAAVAPGGLGVGLQLCAQLARAQKGRFSVRSDRGRGFEATLVFDRYVPAPESQRADPAAVA